MDPALIRTRRAELDEIESRLRADIKAVHDERADLDIAERVFARLTGTTRPALVTEARSNGQKAGAKPDSIPSMPEMIAEAINEIADPDGSEPKDVTAWIANRYWPNVAGDRISSIIWRMWKRGDLRKDGSRYMLPNRNEAVTDLLGGSTATASGSNHKGDDDAPSII